MTWYDTTFESSSHSSIQPLAPFRPSVGFFVVLTVDVYAQSSTLLFLVDPLAPPVSQLFLGNLHCSSCRFFCFALPFSQSTTVLLPLLTSSCTPLFSVEGSRTKGSRSLGSKLGVPQGFLTKYVVSCLLMTSRATTTSSF